MLSISHAATGALIAKLVPNPVVAIPLILLSHYLEDAVPHWDVGTGLSKGTKTRRNAFIHEIPDFILAGIIVLLLFPPAWPLRLDIFTFPPYWGAFVALLPDFLEAPRNFLGSEPRILRPVNRFHHSFHHSIPNILAGLAPQLIVLTVIWILR